MKRTITCEHDVQKLIFDYPWLLDVNFEKIPTKEIDMGWEVQIAGQNRIDLLFRHRLTGRPVIVEFKKDYFYRENIGQLLDYRARILNEVHSETSILLEIFKEKIFSPILCLVVKGCDDYSRAACNLSGIEVFEYKNLYKDVKIEVDISDLEKMSKTLQNDDIPWGEDRWRGVEERVYLPIKSILRELKLDYGWCEYRNPSGEYKLNYNRLFINKWLFKDEAISIGIYEDFTTDNDIHIEFYSDEKSNLELFIEFYEKNCIRKGVLTAFPEEPGFYYTLKYTRQDFFKNKDNILRNVMIKYKEFVE